MIAVVFWYYQRTTELEGTPGLPLPLTTAEGYTPEIHTSEPQAPGQDDIPQEKRPRVEKANPEGSLKGVPDGTLEFSSGLMSGTASLNPIVSVF